MSSIASSKMMTRTFVPSEVQNEIVIRTHRVSCSIGFGIDVLSRTKCSNVSDSGIGDDVDDADGFVLSYEETASGMKAGDII